MSRDYYPHSSRSVASTSATPYDTPNNSDWTTTRPSSRHNHHSSQALIPASKPQLSLLKQEILSEEEYVQHLSDIIKRDFFPALRTLEGQHDILQAYESEDPSRIEESVRRMREICTPTPKRRHRASTPGRTPYDGSSTPTYFDATPDSRFTSTPRPSSSAAPTPRIDPTISLDAFQSRYTSEDNSSFAVLLARDNAARRQKYSWAWEAEKRAKMKAVMGREARERLVNVTKRMVESSKDGSVRMLEGVAGRPSEMRLIVEGSAAEGMRIGEGERLLIEGKSSGEGGQQGRLRITAPGAPERLSEEEMKLRREKGKEVVRMGKGRAVGEQFTDWERATAEEEEDNMAPRRDAMQVPIDGWGFTNRNSFMFPPDADVDPTNPSLTPSLNPLDPAYSSSIASKAPKEGPMLPPSEPKGVRYHATRLEKLEKGASFDSLSRTGSESVRSGDTGGSSPSRSRIGAAIAGTPYPNPHSSTPKVSGFSFVDALPTPSAASLPAASLQELMTWGTIEATPVTLRSTGDDYTGAAGPFRINDTSRRERLATEMARKAKRSLADRAEKSGGGGKKGLAVGGLRRSVLDSVRGGGGTPRTPGTPGSPRSSALDLSPAASALLGRTGQGKALAGGLSKERGWNEEEERRRVERARQRAREVESRERLRRERWTASPALIPQATRFASAWSQVKAGPPDAILGVTEAFKADKSPVKINLGVGAYRDAEGKPYVLPSVRTVDEQIVQAKNDKEYLPITGFPEFTKQAAILAYGKDSKPLQDGRIAITQSISGTGALRIAGAFLERHYPHSKAIYLPSPTWGNHIPIFKDSGLEVKTYSYYDKNTVGLDFEGLKKDMEAAPPKSVFLLHACAHNPTGIDPTKEQWKEISQIMKEKEHFPLFDSAYQGFATGSVDADAFAPRHFVEQGHQIALCQSFAKNMGLYGERIGAFSVVCESAEEKARVDSQIKILVRPLYSNPPVHGARIAGTILSDPALYEQWLKEVKGMADRIITMRTTLYDLLNELGSKKEWGHIKSQIGMFCYTGLTADQVAKLASEHHVYLTKDGRISVAGVTPGNVRHLAESIHAVTK
ncbi:pyridoxal phosphate-dependent transferase [Leucosporidium creatinivorum]|uniref:Aspartate aminotransferase n=1 Tax=Leucosporidium creatinivorum TaxID=106004 RepID=A0A1Y2F4N5_9BASI|nr:pyridoxal phosphate-dependent transferase [Leucosporidium creatinivorum]